MSRRATVGGVQTHGTVTPRYHDAPGGAAGVPVPAPFIGTAYRDPTTHNAVTAGLFHAPLPGAQVVVHRGEAIVPYPIGTSSTTADPTTLPLLAAGETVIWGPHNEVLSYAPVTGPVVLYRNAAGTLAVTVDPATNRINLLCSGGLYVNGTAVSIP